MQRIQTTGLATISLIVFCAISAATSISRADIYRWDNGQVIPGTEGITPGPGVQLDHLDLQYADLVRFDLSGADLSQSNLTSAIFHSSTLTGTNLSGANLTGAGLGTATLADAAFSGATVTNAKLRGISEEQLYSTASYQQRYLPGVSLNEDVSGWNLSGQDLSNASLSHSSLTGTNLSGANLSNASFAYSALTDADLTDAILAGAMFYDTTSRGFTEEQLYSTASYKQGDLQGMNFNFNDLSGWDFSGKDLTGSSLYANLTGTDLSDAVVTGASLDGTTGQGFTKEQLYSTLSYQQQNLQGIGLGDNNLAGWDLSGQDMRGGDIGARTSQTNVHNTVQPSGVIAGLTLNDGEQLIIRNHHGNQLLSPNPIPIKVERQLAINDDGQLLVVLDGDAWNSTISFEPGIPVELGGILELVFAPDVSVAEQVGRTFQLFDWTAVTPTGTFRFESPNTWDVSRLYTSGEVTLMAVPEPATFSLLISTAIFYVCNCRRIARHSPHEVVSG